MKIALLTLGCKVNQAEMAEMDSALKGRGHEIVGLESSPDYCIINTCTVTSKSDYHSRQIIRKAIRSGAKVLVTGCYAELKPEGVRELGRVEGLIANTDKHNIISRIDNNSEGIGSSKVVLGRTRCFLKVQDGCNNQCTYCLVWKARGVSRSRPIEEVIRQAEEVASAGYREIILTGIHLGTYGLDLGKSLSDLIEALIVKLKGFRIRLSSIEVNELDDRLLELMSHERVCKHLHIPLQSGDDGVLRSMGRKYDSKQFINKIEGVYGKFKGLGLGTDIIAGYPVEDGRAFDNTSALVSSMPFTYLHVFPYSSRPGTVAAELKDMVGDKVRRKRAEVLRSLGQMMMSEFLKTQVGMEHDLIIESGTSTADYVYGLSENYLRIKVLVKSGEMPEPGSLLRVRTSDIQDQTLVGQAVLTSC